MLKIQVSNLFVILLTVFSSAQAAEPYACASNCSAAKLGMHMNSSNAYKYDEKSCTPLHYEAQRGNWSKITDLLRESCDINAPLQSPVTWLSGATPLHLAVRYSKSPQTVYILIKNGANLSAKTDKGGCTPLHWAVQAHDSTMVGCLIVFYMIQHYQNPRSLWLDTDGEGRSSLKILEGYLTWLTSRQMELSKMQAKAMLVGDKQVQEKLSASSAALEKLKTEIHQIQDYVRLSQAFNSDSLDVTDIHRYGKDLLDRSGKRQASL